MHTLIKVVPLINSTIVIISAQSVRYESLAKRNLTWNCAVTVDLTHADSIKLTALFFIRGSQSISMRPIFTGKSKAATLTSAS
jgi:hypothetical protein